MNQGNEPQKEQEMNQEQEPQENKMGVKPVPGLLITMAIPLMFSLLIQSLYNIVDGIFVARLSEKALTATSLAYPMQLLMVAIGVGTSVGLNAYLSHSVGEKDREKSSHIATTGMILAIVSAAVFMVLGAGAYTFAGWFTEDSELADMCGLYLQICMVFCLGMFVQVMAQRFLQAVGDTVLSMISLIIGAVVNMVLDPVFIFGFAFVPAMGIKGAAIATVIGQWCGGITAVVLNLFYNREVRMDFRNFHFRAETVKKIYQVGLPTIIMQAMGSIMVSTMNVILMPFSVTAVAFFGIYYKLQNFLFMPMNGLGQAAIPIVGYNLGAGKKERIKAVYTTIIPAAALIGVVGTLIFVVFPRQLLLLFSASDALLAMGVPALRIISLTFVLSSLTTVLGYSASGLGNGMINMLGTALRQFIIYVPATWLLAELGNVELIWYAAWIAEICALAYSAVSVRRLYRQTVIYATCG